MRTKQVRISDTHTWYVGGNLVPQQRRTYIVIPVDQIAGIDHSQIGSRVRSLVTQARLIQAEDDATRLRRMSLDRLDMEGQP